MQAGEQHGRDHGDRVGLEEIRRHAGAVTDVVAHVVGNDRRVARVVLGDAGLDLAHEIGADVRALGEDAAAETREDRDQRAAEGKTDQRVQRLVHAAREAQHQREVRRDADEPQADDQHPGDRAAAERDLQSGVETDARGMRRAHVGAHRDVHADVAGETGEDRADREAAGGRPAERETEDHEEHDADDGDRRVLAVEIRSGALLDGGGDFLHPGVAGGLREDPACGDDAVKDRNHARADREPQREISGHFWSSRL